MGAVGQLIQLPTHDGVRMAAERLASTTLSNFDTHEWAIYPLLTPRWVCADCWLPLETASRHPCTGRAAMH
jgi:hypothetical protein